MADRTILCVTYINKNITWINLHPMAVKHQIKWLEIIWTFAKNNSLLNLVLWITCCFHNFNNHYLKIVRRNKQMRWTCIEDCVRVSFFKGKGVKSCGVTESNSLKKSWPKEIWVHRDSDCIQLTSSLHALDLRRTYVNVRSPRNCRLHVEVEFVSWDLVGFS